MRRPLGVGILLVGVAAITAGPAAASAAPGAASAATKTVNGTMTGPGGFRFEGCPGVVTQIGSGTYAATGLGRGTYTFRACVQSTFPVTFAGTITFMTTHGARLDGTLGGVFAGGPGPLFDITVTGGTRKFTKARGHLTIGPLVASGYTNCEVHPGGVCFDWTDTAPVTGALRHGRER